MQQSSSRVKGQGWVSVDSEKIMSSHFWVDQYKAKVLDIETFKL
jgi:hypothetical protein